MTCEQLATLNALGRPKLLVIGDLILDHYTFGNVERVSPEAPIPVLQVHGHEARLGGAANVCQMLRGLEVQVDVAGAVGCDPAGETLRRLLDEAQVNVDHVIQDDQRPTTVKERFVGLVADRHSHQILRVDTESTKPLSTKIQDDLISSLTGRLDAFDAVLISDYNKGVCTPRLLRAIIDTANKTGIPVIVDPMRGKDYSRYRGATVLTPNGLEAELATGKQINRPQDAIDLSHVLCQQLSVRAIIVTLGCDGMTLVLANGEGQLLSTRPRRVYDVTGAGDVVAAVIGVCLADGVSLRDAARLANVAGGLEVEKLGGVVVKRGDIRRDLRGNNGRDAKVVTLHEMAEIAESYRANGKRIVFTNGCFDLFHAGHVSYLESSASAGDVLVVGLNSDASVRRLKGQTRPVITETDRAAILSALACVDHVLIFDEDTPHEVLRGLRPDVLVKGGTYRQDEVIGREIVLAYGGDVLVTDVVEGVSTTEIINSVQAHSR